MSAKVTGIRQGDVLKLDVPDELPEGTRVELQLARILPEGHDERTPAERAASFEAAVQALQEEAAKYQDEWWDEFERDVLGNRLNLSGRVLLSEKGGAP